MEEARRPAPPEEEREAMRDPTREERAAMWLYHVDYAESRLGAIDFWKALHTYQKNNVRRMVKEILQAEPLSKVMRKKRT